MTDLQARAEAAADMRRTARELRENVGRDFSAVMEALQWEEKAATIEAAIVEHLSRELDITNADHIALWLDANMEDSPMGWLACRIVEAHERAAALHRLAERDRCNEVIRAAWGGEAPSLVTIDLAAVRNEAREEAAAILDAEVAEIRAYQRKAPLDNFLRGQINSALRMRDAIRALQQKGPSNG